MFNSFRQEIFCARDDVFFNVFRHVKLLIFSSKKFKDFFCIRNDSHENRHDFV